MRQPVIDPRDYTYSDYQDIVREAEEMRKVALAQGISRLLRIFARVAVLAGRGAISPRRI